MFAFVMHYKLVVVIFFLLYGAVLPLFLLRPAQISFPKAWVYRFCSLEHLPSQHDFFLVGLLSGLLHGASLTKSCCIQKLLTYSCNLNGSHN